MALSDNNDAYYKFDTNNTTQPDATGNGNSCTMTNATYTSSGKINGAYSFDGNGDYGQVGSKLIPSTGDFTISVWFTLTNTSGFKTIISQHGGGTGRMIMGIDSNILEFQLNGSAIMNSSSTLSTGTFYHYVVVRSGNNFTMYLNNSSEDTATTSNIVQQVNTQIGVYNTSFNYHNGKIDEASFWTRALSSDEVGELYNSGSGFQYPYDEEDEENNSILFGTNI